MRAGKTWWAVDVRTWLLLLGEVALAEQVREGDMMPVDPELLELFVSEVEIEPYVSSTFDHVDTFGASVTYSAKIDAKIEEVLRKTGDVAVSSHRVVLDDVYEIDERDRITMPSNIRFKVANPEILAVRSWTDENAITATELGHHTTLMIGARKGARA